MKLRLGGKEGTFDIEVQLKNEVILACHILDASPKSTGSLILNRSS